jgi:hypothetical protein
MGRGWRACLLLSAIMWGCVAPGSTSWSGAPEASTRAVGAATTALTGLPIPFEATAIRYPAGWQVAHYDVPNSFYQSIAFIGPEPLPDPCTRAVNTITCASWPPIRLPANGVVVGLWSDGFPGWTFDPNVGRPADVGGHPATVEVLPADDACRSIGGDERMVVTIPMPVQWDWWEVDACLRGPDHAANETIVRALLGLS